MHPRPLVAAAAAGAQLRTWPQEAMQAALCASHELHNKEVGAPNPRFRWIRKGYRVWRHDRHQWFRMAENSFENFAHPAAAGR